MNSGTRRMWSRRVLRAGWALAPVLRFPAKIWSFFFGTWEATRWTIGLGTVAFLVGSCTARDIKHAQVASGAEIEAALKDNPCMIELMPRRQKLDKKGEPLTVGDLRMGNRDCNAAWQSYSQVSEQKAALKRAGAKVE